MGADPGVGSGVGPGGVFQGEVQGVGPTTGLGRVQGRSKGGSMGGSMGGFSIALFSHHKHGRDQGVADPCESRGRSGGKWMGRSRHRDGSRTEDRPDPRANAVADSGSRLKGVCIIQINDITCLKH